MNTLCLIPARGGSKGVPGKNLASLGGRPLIVHTIEAAIEADLSPIVSTDDDSIADVARNAGAEVPFLRPSELASDSAGQVEVALHALQWWRDTHPSDPDVIVLLQPTSPLRTANDLRRAMATFASNLEHGSESLVSVTKVLQHPSDMVYQDQKGLQAVAPSQGTGRQSYEDCFFIDGAIYMCTPRYLVENNALFGPDTTLFELPRGRTGIDIDEPDELEIIRAIFAHQKDQKQ